MNSLQKRTWAEVDLGNLEYNYNKIRSILPGGTKLLGIVKADAYGHGAVEVAKRLEKCGADYLAIACLDEAIELRKNGVTLPILILGHTPPEFVNLLLEYDLTQTVSCEAKAIEFSDAAKALGGTLRIHIKLDTGMCRLGFLCTGGHFEDGVKNLVSACTLPNLDAEGVYTHFPVSDKHDADNKAFTRKQFEVFTSVIAAAERQGVRFRLRHCANSAAVVNYPEMALDMVRTGMLMYGYRDDGRLGLKPVMKMVSTVSTIKYIDAGSDVGYNRTFTAQKRMRMGVVPAGYADGLPWAAAKGGVKLYVEGKPAALCGSVSMDMCVVDLSDIPEAKVGSEVEIFGENNDIIKFSADCGTIYEEIMCAVSKRVPRIYIG